MDVSFERTFKKFSAFYCALKTSTFTVDLYKGAVYMKF